MGISSFPQAVPSPFILLDAIAEAQPERLTAYRHFAAAPAWQAMEAAAQCAAMHQRWLAGFTCHAFLLSIDECALPETPLDGTVRLLARLTGQSAQAALYQVTLQSLEPDQRHADKTGCPMHRHATHHDEWKISLAIGRIPYDGSFQQPMLESRYRELFRCLTNALPFAPRSNAG